MSEQILPIDTIIATIVEVEKTGSGYETVVQIIDQDGSFCGYDPTDEQIREIAAEEGLDERQATGLWIRTTNYHQRLAKTALWELKSDIGDAARDQGMPGNRIPESEEDILNGMAMGKRNIIDLSVDAEAMK